MGTSTSEVTDMFLTRINDYRLTTIYQTSGSGTLNQYLEPFLIDSNIMFSDFCDQDLTYTICSGSVEGYYTETLTTEHISILSQIMVKFWLAKTISDILQMQNHVTDRDFKTFSSSQNLKSKQDYYVVKLEEIDQLLTNYSLKKNNWVNWRSQIFYE
jgi:hypothetical protein